MNVHMCAYVCTYDGEGVHVRLRRKVKEGVERSYVCEVKMGKH